MLLSDWSKIYRTHRQFPYFGYTITFSLIYDVTQVSFLSIRTIILSLSCLIILLLTHKSYISSVLLHQIILSVSFLGRKYFRTKLFRTQNNHFHCSMGLYSRRTICSFTIHYAFSSWYMWQFIQDKSSKDNSNTVLNTDFPTSAFSLRSKCTICSFSPEDRTIDFESP